MSSGFQLRTLQIEGPGKSPAVVEFKSGFNLISGASETGKSYILRCIDFMFGASKPPKFIDASSGYDRVRMRLTDLSDREFELVRAMEAGDFQLTQFANSTHPDQSTTFLAAKQSAKKANVSQFFLQLSGLADKKIKKKAAAAPAAMSFREIAKFLLVDEVTIISESSPVHHGQWTEEPKEDAIFKLLLTGNDDSALIVAYEGKSEDRRFAQTEVLDLLIERVLTRLGAAPPQLSTLNQQIQMISSGIESTASLISTAQKELLDLETQRRSDFEKIQGLKSKLVNRSELVQRFELLEKNYISDRARLSALLEADHFFSQLKEERCPLCGSPPDKHDYEACIITAEGDELDVKAACEHELAKINKLAADLASTIAALKLEIQNIQQELNIAMGSADTLNHEIHEKLIPRANESKAQLTELLKERDQLQQINILASELQELRSQRDAVSKQGEPEAKPKLKPPKIRDTKALENLCVAIQELLEEWNFPNLGRVTFSESSSDLVIGGRDRASLGKGYRAIAYAAFAIGLLRHCRKYDYAHPGLIVLDSPLLNYKAPDTGPQDKLPQNIKESFFRSLAKTPADQQIIVLENENPPADLEQKINYQHFSKFIIGRYGLFPSQ
jgi:hypothetical protein